MASGFCKYNRVHKVDRIYSLKILKNEDNSVFATRYSCLKTLKLKAKGFDCAKEKTFKFCNIFWFARAFVET